MVSTAEAGVLFRILALIHIIGEHLPVQKEESLSPVKVSETRSDNGTVTWFRE